MIPKSKRMKIDNKPKTYQTCFQMRLLIWYIGNYYTL